MIHPSLLCVNAPSLLPMCKLVCLIYLQAPGDHTWISQRFIPNDSLGKILSYPFYLTKKDDRGEGGGSIETLKKIENFENKSLQAWIFIKQEFLMKRSLQFRWSNFNPSDFILVKTFPSPKLPFTKEIQINWQRKAESPKGRGNRTDNLLPR